MSTCNQLSFIGTSITSQFGHMSPKSISGQDNLLCNSISLSSEMPTARTAWRIEFPDNMRFSPSSILPQENSRKITTSFGPITTKPELPNISKGLGQRQDKKDLVKLEHFIAENTTLMVYKDDLCVFKPPCWRKLTDRQAEVHIREVLQQYDQSDCLTQREYQAIRRALLINPALQVDRELYPQEYMLNFSDGTFDIKSCRLLPHSPEDNFFSYINIRYRDICSCEGNFFESFVQNISDGDPSVRELLLQLVLLTILRVQTKYFFVLLGPSNTGKSQFGRFLEELVGRDNVESIRDVGDFADRWTTGNLAGKLLATCLDLPDGPLPLSAVGIIKQFVGDDPIKGERKYQNPFTYYQKPLLLLAGNHPLQIPRIEREEALLNRMVTIPFYNPVAVCDMRHQLYKNLLDEAPYIVGQAIRTYDTLEQNNFHITRITLPEELTPKDSRVGYRSVAQFLEQCCVRQPRAEVATCVLFDAYCQYANCENISFTEFSRNLGEFLCSKSGVRPIKRVLGTDRRGYQGLTLIEK